MKNQSSIPNACVGMKSAECENNLRDVRSPVQNRTRTQWYDNMNICERGDVKWKKKKLATQKYKSA